MSKQSRTVAQLDGSGTKTAHNQTYSGSVLMEVVLVVGSGSGWLVGLGWQCVVVNRTVVRICV